MDARELTKKFYDLEYKNDEKIKKVEYLMQEVSKLRMIMNDIQIDMKMMQRERKN